MAEDAQKVADRVASAAAHVRLARGHIDTATRTSLGALDATAAALDAIEDDVLAGTVDPQTAEEQTERHVQQAIGAVGIAEAAVTAATSVLEQV